MENEPFTHETVKSLTKGFTPSGNGPNRKQRRNYLQKSTRNPSYGFHVHHWQTFINKNGELVRIPHFSLHATKGNW